MTKEFKDWASGDFNPPAPTRVKRGVLRRWSIPEASWIETGTYKGSTAKWLASFAPQVITLEPMSALYGAAVKRLQKYSNVELLNEGSETGLETAIQKINGSKVNFWLDGHYSDGPTFRGARDTPIEIELKVIADNLAANLLNQIVVFVDDVRLFVARYRHDATDHERPGYPSLNLLVEWAVANHLTWTIEHDIFIAATNPPECS